MMRQPSIPLDAELARMLELGAKYLAGDEAAERDREEADRERKRIEAIWNAMVPAMHQAKRPDDPQLPLWTHPTLTAGEHAPANMVATMLSRWRPSATASGNVIIQGPSGSGKTSLAIAGLRGHFERRPHEVLFAPAFDLASARIQHPTGRGEAPIIAQALGVRLLVIDDLGNEAHASGAIATLRDLVWKRYENGRPTWVTTAYELDKLEHFYGEIVRRRLEERALVIRCQEPRKGAP